MRASKWLAVPVWMIAGASLFLGLLLGASGCTRRNALPKEIPPMEAMGMLQNDFAVLVDVREPGERAEGGIAQARLMPWSEIQAQGAAWNQFVAGLPKDKHIVFYGSGTENAKKAADLLAAKGYKTGFMASYRDWAAAGLPTRK